jgi:hypothetical protein
MEGIELRSNGTHVSSPTFAATARDAPIAIDRTREPVHRVIACSSKVRVSEVEKIPQSW